MKTFREKAKQISALYVSTQAIEKLMDYVEKNPQVWADILTDEVTLRMLCTAALAKENNAARTKVFNAPQSATFDFGPAETHSKRVTDWTPEKETAATQRMIDRENEGRRGLFEMSVHGYRIGDLTRKTAKQVENLFRAGATHNARQVSFFRYIRENLPNDTIKVRDHFMENTLKLVHNDTDPYIIIRKRGQAEEKV